MSLPNSFTGACRSLSESPVIAFCRLTYEAFRASCNFSGSVMGAGCAPVFGVPESTPMSMPFSLTIRLNTSPTERTPWPGFQSYLPDIIFSEGGLYPCRLPLRLRQRHHQSDRKRAHSVLNQNLLHVELLYVT